MKRFVQFHILTSYPPSNLNRDDLGRPKTASIGGVHRLRISSQSLKRAWRKSELFEMALAGHIGIRTREQGREVYKQLTAGGVEEKQAREWARKIAGVFGELEAEKKSADAGKKKAAVETEDAVQSSRDLFRDLYIRQLAHFSNEELAAIDALTKTLIQRKSEPTTEELKLLRRAHSAADIALFGRMLAAAPEFNTDAAVQVAHAFTVHRSDVEDDFFTAVDDLNTGIEDVGAGHLGEHRFAAGLFYLYVCVNRQLLLDNLQTNGAPDRGLADKTLQALLEAAARVAPTGKQNSYASRAHASYILVEKGDQQPRSLAAAFLSPVHQTGYLEQAIEKLTQTRANFDKVYGAGSDGARELSTLTGEGSLKELLDFVAAD